MTKKVLVPVSNGFEELEFVAPVDIMRRAGLEVTIATLGNSDEVVGAHGLVIKGDCLLSNVSSEFDAVVCPGGMDCAISLGKDQHLLSIIKELKQRGKLIAAICASPVTILEKNGLLADVDMAVCYPMMIHELKKPDPSRSPVCVSSNVVTSQGPGTAVCFGLKIVEILCGKEQSDDVATAIVANTN